MLRVVGTSSAILESDSQTQEIGNVVQYQELQTQLNVLKGYTILL